VSARRRRDIRSEAVTVFIVAASDVVRAGLESLIGSDPRFTVAGNAAELPELAEGPTPDVVVVDVEGQAEQSLDALRAFMDETDEVGDAPAFVVIGASPNEAVTQALRARVVRALLPREASGGEIMAAIEAVSAGLFVLDAETFAALFSSATFTVDEGPGARPGDERLPLSEPHLDALTPREREVLDMLAEGLSNKEIAWRMKISEHTVKFHVASVFAKLGVSTRTEAVMQGIRRGLVML
jgi:two-component system, NarL family, response regulator YdfI